MSDIKQRLTVALPDLPKKLAHAARYALDNPQSIAFDSMRTVATACGVASPTMLRLARALDYESYEDFRGEFQQRLSTRGFEDRAAALRDVSSTKGKSTVSERIAQAAENNIALTMQNLDASAVEYFAQSVKNAERTFILGSGSMHWMAALMESTGQMAIRGLRTDHSGSATLVETISSITEKDTILVMAFAPYAKETVLSASYAKSRGAKVFAITDKASSPLTEHAEQAFITPTDSPHYFPSVVAVTLMVEILLSAAVAASDTLERIKQREQIRRDSGAYL
jgi:DNA-binding MurR/RpiR family transcriptional regulator